MARALPLSVAAVVAMLVAAGVTRAEAADPNLLVLQATTRIAVSLAEGNYCAGQELRPLLEAARAYLEGAGEQDVADGTLIDETVLLLRAVAYDQTPCDQACAGGAAVAAPEVEPFGAEATARLLAAIDAVTERWLDAAEDDPPVLSLATSRSSYDPLPRYAAGEAVSYAVHVGAACHGAVLWLDRAYELPSNFEGNGMFTPPREGLWTIDLRRRDGLPLSPLTYLDEAGLPAYVKEFWVRDEPTTELGPGSLSPWHPRP